ncbi:MAG: hypothetical protein GY862_33485, partial [Gammaproteobacteria bacterium]|nr:hypothetical protein [Gammaproteobacteria bacterium]
YAEEAGVQCAVTKTGEKPLKICMSWQKNERVNASLKPMSTAPQNCAGNAIKDMNGKPGHFASVKEAGAPGVIKKHGDENNPFEYDFCFLVPTLLRGNAYGFLMAFSRSHTPAWECIWISDGIFSFPRSCVGMHMDF